MLYAAECILGQTHGEDAVHDVFVKLVEMFEANPEFLGDKPGQYFVVMVRNHAINLKAKEKRARGNLVALDDGISFENDSVFQEPTGPEGILIEGEAFERLVALIRRMKPGPRQIIEYKYIIGYTNKEIAEILGISQTAVSTRIDKAKRRLKAMLANGEAGGDAGGRQ
jgi:RNA polymerase sigma-70 factor (ECF subfamily)